MRITVILASGERLRYNNVTSYDLNYSDDEIHIVQLSPGGVGANTFISKRHVVLVTIGE